MSIPENVILKQMQVGLMGNYIYFIGDKASGQVAVVDPAWDADFLCAEAKKNGYEITHIFLTHGHQDHVNAVDALLATHDIPVIISKHETGISTREWKRVQTVDNGDKLKVGSLEFECLHTPGHTQGGQCFKYNDILITGDTLFVDGCGRCDFSGGDARVMYNTLYHVLLKLPETTVIYPGHNYGPTPCATLASQKKTNPYLQCQSMEEFLRQRMGMAI